MRRALLSVLLATPFLVLVAVSVGVPGDGPTWAHWSLLWGAGIPLVDGLRASVWVALPVALTSTLLGAGMARWLHRARLRGNPWASVLLASAWLPWALSPVMAGMLLMVVYLVVGMDGTLATVMLAHLVFSGAYAVVLMEAFWRRDIARYEDVGRSLGAGGARLVRHVLWPVLRRPLALVFAQTFLISWFQYGVTLAVGAGRIQTLPLLVFGFVGEANVYLAAMASLVLVLPPLVLLWAFRLDATP